MAEKAERMTREEMLADIDLQIKQQQLANARLQEEQLLASLEDTRESLDERRLKREGRAQVQRDQAKQLADEESQRRARILDCPHRKGGMDFAGWRKGDKAEFAIMKHMFPNGDYWCKCTRCTNDWVLPVEPVKVEPARFSELAVILRPYWPKFKPGDAGYFLKTDKDGYTAARVLYRAGLAEFNEAMTLPTMNIASTSGLAKQTGGDFDWVRLYRIAMHESLGIPIFQAQKYHALSKGGEEGEAA